MTRNRAALTEGADPDNVFLWVGDERVSIAAFVAMKPNAKTVYARGCAALTALSAPNAEAVDVANCAALTALSAPNAEAVDVENCAALTALSAPNAKTVYVLGCAALTALSAPNAETVYVLGCAALAGWEWIDGGCDSRGYAFGAVKIRGDWRIIAGCRNFAPAEALKHWSRPRAAAGCLAIAQRLVDEIERRESVRTEAADG